MRWNPRLEPRWTTEDARCLRDPGRSRGRVRFSELVLSGVQRDVHTLHGTSQATDVRVLAWEAEVESEGRFITPAFYIA